VVEGEGAIGVVRTTNGATDPAAAAPGTIRGDFAHVNPFNLVHGSDSPESAEREIGLWFGAGELV
jgi:nucleoside-diphosphate kinase